MDEKLKNTIHYIIDIKKIKDVTPKKLQKLLYYIYSWHMVLTAENSTDDELKRSRIFNATFEAWVHGPVDRDVYNKYKEFGYDVIQKSGFENVEFSLNEDEIDSINQVLEVYGDMNGNELEYLTHNETPWINARGNVRPLDLCSTTLNDSIIYTYYISKLEN